MKRTLYPKTQRITPKTRQVLLTEKLDGSNLGLFVKDGELYIAQRNHVFNFLEIEDVKGSLYKGLYAFLKKHGEQLQGIMHPYSIVFGEWLGMGKIKYPELTTDTLDRWYVFAKGVVDINFNVSRLNYDLDDLKYPFGGEIPSFVHQVPLIYKARHIPSIEGLDAMYEKYKGEIRRRVEGIVVIANGTPVKYIRSKNGEDTPHVWQVERDDSN